MATMAVTITITITSKITMNRVVTDNKDLGFATSQEELAEMCPKLMDGLRYEIVVIIIITIVIIF